MALFFFTSPQKRSRIRPFLSLTGVARSEGPMFLKVSNHDLLCFSSPDSPDVTLRGGVAVGAPNVGLGAPPSHVTCHRGRHVITHVSLKQLVTRDQNLMVRQFL